MQTLAHLSLINVDLDKNHIAVRVVAGEVLKLRGYHLAGPAPCTRPIPEFLKRLSRIGRAQDDSMERAMRVL